MLRWIFLSASGCASVFILGTIDPVYPWGEKGHHIVAYIAEANLTAPALKQVKSVLGKESLADASYWPDLLRREMRDLDSLHYINLPPDATSYDRQRDCPDRNCIVEALPWYIRILAAEDTPKSERRIALRFVAHLVGDIHQPLHAGYLENRGGNTIRVMFRGKEMNLHSLWDRGLLETDQRSAEEIAKNLGRAITRQEMTGWQSGDSVT